MSHSAVPASTGPGSTGPGSTVPGSTAEALRMLSSAMSYLAAADPTAMSAQAQGDCLLALERLDAVEAAALAEGTVLTESMARTVCGWTSQLPQHCWDTADDILVAAARAGARREDVAALAMEIYARSLTGTDDDGDPDQSFGDRASGNG